MLHLECLASEKRGKCSALGYMGKVSDDVLCPALGTTLQERCRQIGESAKENSKNDQRFGKYDLQEKVERTGFV